MQKLSIIMSVQVLLAVSVVGLRAVENEAFTGTAARSGTYKRPLLDVDGKRYELKASDNAEASVAEMLAKFSQGDTGSYAVVGTRGTVNGKDGIIIDSIAPADRSFPSAGTTAPGTNAAQGNVPSAAAPTTPAVTSSVVTVGSDQYLVYNYDDLTTRNHTVVIPEGLKTVRGLLVNACYAGGDSRHDWTICEYYRQFMHLHGFAYVGCTSTAGSPVSAPPAEDTVKARHRAIFRAFQDSIQVIATVSEHPELVNAPYVGVGFSAGGGFAFNVMAFAPEKTIAAVSYCSPYNFKRRITPPPSEALLNVPSICITGELEHFNAPLAPDVDPSTGPARIDEVFLPYRPKGATYAWMERQGIGHEYDQNRQDVLGMPLLDAAVRARYPKDADVTKGPVKLLPIDPSTGWVADNTTWKSGLTKIVPAKEFKGDLGHSSWLLNEDIAFIYRAYSTHDKLLTITSPGNCWPTVPALDPGASVPIIVDDSEFPNWKMMTFYDGAKKLAEITQGPTQFTATNLTPGYHVFSVLATDGQGNARTADPKMVVVRLPDEVLTFDADVAVVRRFPANKGPGWKDSIDVAGAVGPRHVVDFDVAGFVVHDKTSGEVLRQLSTREFWKRVEPAGTLVPQENANDARMLYDPLSERWFACAAGTTEPDCFLAVSTSSDPTEPWLGVRLPLPRVNPYMKMGVDRNGLYICSCNGNADMNQGTNCYAIPKRDAIADGGPVLTRDQTFTGLQFSTMPAMDPDPDKPADAPAILLANEFMNGICSKLYLYKITWLEPGARISDVQTIPLSRRYLTPNNTTPQMEAFQPKPGPKLRAGGGGRRIDSVFVRNGAVFGCNGAKRTADSRPGVLWYEVRISDGALVQEGLVDSPDRDFIFPSVAVDSQGNIGIGCTGTSQTEFPSVYVMMHAASDPPNLMSKPLSAIPGTTAYHYAGVSAVNLSHYSTTCIDPSNPDLLWTCQAYSNSKIDRQWCTAWAAFQVSRRVN